MMAFYHLRTEFVHLSFTPSVTASRERARRNGIEKIVPDPEAYEFARVPAVRAFGVLALEGRLKIWKKKLCCLSITGFPLSKTNTIRSRRRLRK
jgi:hypothetical protein